jgi:hypothetical protein
LRAAASPSSFNNVENAASRSPLIAVCLDCIEVLS